MAAQVAASSFRVLVPSDLPKAIARAFASFEGARPRPVHIEIPVDLFGENADGLPAKRAAKIHPPRPSEQASNRPPRFATRPFGPLFCWAAVRAARGRPHRRLPSVWMCPPS